MAYKVVKYRLEADGTIPTWLKFGVPQSTGGMYPIADNGADISGAIAEISSKSDLQTYLSDQATANSWTDPDPDDMDATVAFDAAAHASKVWNDLTTLNGG